jgi:hypothetical protein
MKKEPSIQSFLLAVSRFVLGLALLLFVEACARQPNLVAPQTLLFGTPEQVISQGTRIYLEYPRDHFGGSVDIDGDLLAAGAPAWRLPPQEAAGSAYVYRSAPDGDWALDTTLTASDKDDGFQYGQHFGESVAVSGMVIAVGVPGYDHPQEGDNTGAVFIFEHNGQDWVETDRLIPSEPVPGAKIGRSLVFDGDLLAASGSPISEYVYIYKRETGGWRELSQVPVPSTPDGEPPYVLIDLYGDSLAVSSVSMPPLPDEPDIEILRRTGTVAIYERAGEEWEQAFRVFVEASLYMMLPDTPFGISVSLGGDAGQSRWLAVGRPGFPGSGRETGSVEIYAREKSGWALVAELALEPGEPAPGALPFFGPHPAAAFFGSYVDMEGSRLAVVSTFANAVHVFDRRGEGWQYRFMIFTVNKDGHASDDFMRRVVALRDDQLLLGTPGDLGGGVMFLYDLPP